MTLYKLTCLSPIFIGTGEEVSPNEYIKQKDQLLILNSKLIYSHFLKKWYHSKPELQKLIYKQEVEKAEKEVSKRREKYKNKEIIQDQKRTELDLKIKELEDKKSLHLAEFRQLEEARKELKKMERPLPKFETSSVRPINQDPILYLLKDPEHGPKDLISFLGLYEDKALDPQMILYKVGFASSESSQQFSAEVPIHEMVKSGQSHPFIPGSSIKGSIRTCLAYKFLSDLISGTKVSDKPKSIYHSSARVILYLKLVLGAAKYIGELKQENQPDWADSRTKLQSFLNSLDFRGKKTPNLEEEDIVFLLDVLRVRFFDDSNPIRFRAKVIEGFNNLEGWGPGKIGQKLSQMIFGWSPSTDVLRNLTLSDTFLNESSNPNFTLYPVKVISLYKARNEETGSAQLEYVECIEHNTVFTFEMEDLLFDGTIESELKDKMIKKNFWLERGELITDVRDKVNQVMKTRIEEESGIIKTYFKGSPLSQFYEDLSSDINNSKDAMFLRIGSRCGWSMTTVTSLLGDDIIQGVREKHRLGDTQEHNKSQTLFPKTRHLIFKGGVPILPFGWVKIEKVKCEV